MNASLLAALASPGAKPARRPAKPSSGAGSSNTAEAAGKENTATAMGSRPRAPSFTVPETPSAPGRYENIRVLIEEGKKAAAEGRLAAALRKYETAMVTLPEAYKPRLQNKIARLEARLDDEEDRAPGTPARSTPKACRDAAENSDKDPGLLDLLHIAVQDVSAASAAAAAASSGRTATSGVSFCSPRRSSPLVRGLAGSGDAMPSMPCIGGGGSVLPCDQEDGGGGGGGSGLDGDIARLGDRLTASSLAAATAIGDDSYRSPPARFRPAREEGRGGGGGGDGGGDGDGRLHANNASGFSSSEEAASPAGVWGGDNDDHCGLGGAAEEGEEDWDAAEMEGMDTQERLRAVNRGLSDKLEKQVVAVMNQASSEELTELHGIGPRRAQLILQTRATTPFETLADLTRIGMYPKQIIKMGRHNMLECLDVCPAKTEGASSSCP